MNFFVVLDMDSTFIQDEVIDLLADHAGVGEKVAAITERSMRGELDFKASLLERVKLLQGLDSEAIDAVRSAMRLSKGAETLIRSLHAADSKIAIVSGGFENIIAPLLTSLEIDFFKANTLAVEDGKLTGEVVGEIIDKDAKAEFLKTHAQLLNIPLTQTVAVGDGANDLEMMKIAGLSIAFNAKPIVKSAAMKSIDDGDLTHILEFLQIPVLLQ